MPLAKEEAPYAVSLELSSPHAFSLSSSPSFQGSGTWQEEVVRAPLRGEERACRGLSHLAEGFGVNAFLGRSQALLDPRPGPRSSSARL